MIYLRVIVRCGVGWCACVWCLTLSCIGWLVYPLSSLVFCLCVVARCFVNVAFPFVCVLSGVDPAAFYVCKVCRCCATAD